MTGLIDAPVEGNRMLVAEGTSALPASFGQQLGAELGEGFAHAFPSWEIARAESEGRIPTDPGEAVGQAFAAPEPTLSADEANARYGIPNHLSWRAPVPDSVAAAMSARKHDELLRQDIIARGPSGFGSGVAGIAAQLAGGLPGIVDPLNIAASFVPVVPEARAALWAASPLGRLALGAARGAAGQAALLPVQAAIAQHDQESISGVNALLDVALGGIFGGGLHMLAGGRGDALTRAGAGEIAALDAADPAIRESMLRGAIADLADDRPVESPALALEEFQPPRGGRPLNGPEDQSSPGNIGGAPPPVEMRSYAEPGAGARATPYEALPAEPQRLGQFLRQAGGVQLGDELADARLRLPGLVNRNGLALDEATLRAWEAGYLPGAERPETNELVDALDRDLRGTPVYSDQDAMAVAARAEAESRNAEIDRLAQDLGINPAGRSRAEFWDAVADRMSEEQLAREIVARDEAHDEAYRAAVGATEEWREGHGATVPPQPVATAPRTLEELDAEQAELDRSTQALGAAQAGGNGARLAGAAERDQAALEARLGQRGRGVGTRPGAAAEGEPAGSGTEELDAEIAELERAVKAGLGEGEEAPELEEANERQAAAEDWAKAAEQAGLCLARRA